MTTENTDAPVDFLKRFKDAERLHRSYVPRTEYLVLRLDGKAFHTYTKGLERPYDLSFMQAMDKTTAALCSEIDGSVLAYTQSDEISIVIRHQNPETQVWFGGAIQKIVSVSSAIATANFNLQMREQFPDKIAYFDSRVMVFDDHKDVADYLNWRRADSVKNTVSMNASTYFNHRELHGLSGKERKELCAGIGKPWEELPAVFRFGRLLVKEYHEDVVTFLNKKTQQEETATAMRARWIRTAMMDSLTPEQVDGFTRKG